MAKDNNVQNKDVVRIVQFNGMWTREQVAADPANIYIFTDNTDRDSGRRVIDRESIYYQEYGDGQKDLHYPTQTAAVARGLNNAFPVSTQRWYHDGAKGDTGRWQDADLEEFKHVVGEEFKKIRHEIAITAVYKGEVTVFLPGGHDGLAGGMISAITPERTAGLYSFLKDQEDALSIMARVFNDFALGKISNDNESLIELALNITTESADYLGEQFNRDDAQESYRSLKPIELIGIIAESLADLPKDRREEIYASIVPAEQKVDLGDKTVAFGVQLTSSPKAMREEYKSWLKDNPNGIVAYRIFGDKTYSARTVGNNIIGNPFDAQNVSGEEKATKMFFDWLHTGDNFGNSVATDELRKAIVNKLLSLPDDAPVLYYKEIGRPSDATVIGYFIQHKDMLFQGEHVATAVNNSEDQVKKSESTQEKDLSALAHYSPYQLKTILDDVPFPNRGEGNTAFDEAGILINEKLKTGWNRDMTVPQEKAYLLSLIGSLPNEVSDTIINFAKSTMPLPGVDAPAARKVIFEENICDVYTTGFSTKQFDEFAACIPPATKVVIDIREKTDSKYKPWFNKEAITKALSERGIKYVHLSPNQENFFNEIHRLCQENRGQVLICASHNKPEQGLRGLDLGPRLERSGMKVGHVSQGFDSELKRWTAYIMIQTQEELTTKLLAAAGKELKNGSYREVNFTPDGKPIINEDVSLRDKIVKVVVDRNIKGHDNYNNPVAITETERPGTGEALFEAAKQAHFTLVFKSGHPSPLEKLALDAAGGNAAAINVPDDDDRLRDMAYAREVVYGKQGKAGIIEPLKRAMLKQSLEFPDTFNSKDLTLQIEGINEARLLNKPAIDGHVTDEEIQMSGKDWDFNRLGGKDEGFVVVRPSHASLTAFQTFVKNVITVINEPEQKNILGEDRVTEKDYQFKNVISTGDSGAGEAGILAAQELGMSASIQAPNEFRYTIDNGTLQGRIIRDEASFRNRFKLSLKKGIPEDDLRLQIDHVREAGQAQSGPGLTDRQILTLSSLGYTNSDIITLHQQCIANNIKITETPVKADDGKVTMTAAAGLIDLVEQCTEGYGVGESAFSGINENLSPEVIFEAEKDVDKTIELYRRNNIGILTIANPYYPEQFRAYEGFTTEKETQQFIRTENGVYTENVTFKAKEERPVILTFRGNIDALSLDKVAVTGNTKAEAFERHAAENIGRALADEGFAIVTALRPTAAISHSPAVINASLNVLGVDVDHISSRPGKQYTIYGTPVDSPFFAAAAAMDKGATNIAISPNNLLNPEDQDRIQRIIESRGVVFSEARLSDGEGGDDLTERAGHLACALGGKAIVIGSTPESFAMSPAFEASSASLGAVVVKHDIPEGENYKLEGSEKLTAAGAETITPGAAGLNDILSPLRTFSFEEQAEKAVEMEVAKVQQSAGKRGEMHVDNYQFVVVRKGSEQIFVVPSNYPDVRDAVKQAYGPDITFAEDATLAMRNLRDGITAVGGESVRTFKGYTGTQLLQEESYRIPLFYQKGQIYSVVNAPRNTPGIIRSQQSRIDNKKAFDAFKERAEQIQEKFLNQVYAGAEGQHKPIRFENAFYPVITQHSVKIYQGELLRASVFIDERGALKVRTFGNLADDLTEYNYSKYIFPKDIDSEVKKSSNKAVALDAIMLELSARMESVFMSVPIDETEMFALATREQKEDITQRLENQFLKLSEDNLDVAASDIVHGMNAGLLAEFTPSEYSKEDAVAAIIGEMERTEKDIARQMKEDKKFDKKIEDAEKKRDAAYNQGYSVQEYEKMDQAIEDLRAEKCDILSGLTSSRQRYAILQNIKEDIAVADKIFLSKSEALGGSKKLALYVEGGSVEIVPSLITEKTKEKARAEILEINTAKASREKSFHDGIELIETHNANVKELGEIYDRHNAEGFGKAEKSEIKPESFSNGRYIIVRDGKEAYVDQNMNIRSAFYDSLKPWHGNYGQVKNDGKYNFVDPAGEVIVEKWFQSRERITEKTFIIETDGEYGIVNDAGKLIGGRMFQNAHSSSDGWCTVRGGLEDGENAGKYNYISLEGKFLSKTWFDDCNDFKEGKAIVKVGERFKEIDTTGKTLRNNIKVDLKPGQSLFNNGNGRGGRR